MSGDTPTGIVYEARHRDGRTFIGRTTRSLAQRRASFRKAVLSKSQRGKSLSPLEKALTAEPDAFTWTVLAIAPAGEQLAEAKRRAVADLEPAFNQNEYFGPLLVVALRQETVAEIDALAERTGLTQRRLLREAVEAGIPGIRYRLNRIERGEPKAAPAAESHPNASGGNPTTAAIPGRTALE